MNATAAWVTLVLCFALAFALWPFDFQLPSTSVVNGAEVTRDGALAFPAPGIVIDEGAGAILHEHLAGAEAVTIAVVAESDAADQTGPARLVSFGRDPLRANFMIGQEGDRLTVRIRTPETGPFGEVPGLAAPRVIEPGRTQIFVATYDGERLRIYADGRRVAERRLEAGPLVAWSREAQLSFGNEATGNRPWRGRVLDVVVFDVALDPKSVARLRARNPSTTAPAAIYRLSARCPAGAPAGSAGSPGDGRRTGHCEVPAQLEITERFEIFALQARAPADYAENGVLWLVVGWVLGRARGRAAVVSTVLMLATLAVALEAAQSLLPARSSSLLDLSSAIVGLCLGTAYARRRAWRPRVE